ncbi:MAG: nucleotide sugar dehydrogenase [Tissierellaceae bacterium]|nr:nucleotide sugar dehydrogenase [Tissierellaceae bacterium]
MNICVVGVGYIGLPTASVLGNSGHKVCGVDINTSLINRLNNKTYKTEEDRLLDLINKAMDNNNLRFMTFVPSSDVFILCTPTPLDENGNPDLSYLLKALDNTLDVVVNGNLIIIESTIPPGTIRNKVIPKIEDKGLIIGKDIYLAYCPERVMPNNIIHEMINNDRVIGAYTEYCGIKAKEIYSSFVKGEIFVVEPEIAELVKLIENSYRYLNIGFANEIAIICNELKLDPYLVINVSNRHPRVDILQPGIGVGGHCLPVDSQFLISGFKGLSRLIELSHKINDSMPLFISTKIKSLVQDFNNPKITIWGLTYKGNSSDTRNSPAKRIYDLLRDDKLNVEVWDPYLDNNNTQISSLQDSDLLMLLVNHDEVRDFKYDITLDYMNTPIIFDGINILDSINLDPNIRLIKLGNL